MPSARSLRFLRHVTHHGRDAHIHLTLAAELRLQLSPFGYKQDSCMRPSQCIPPPFLGNRALQCRSRANRMGIPLFPVGFPAARLGLLALLSFGLLMVTWSRHREFLELSDPDCCNLDCIVAGSTNLTADDLCAQAQAGIPSAEPSFQTRGYNEYSSTASCVQIAEHVHKVRRKNTQGSVQSF